MKDEEEISRMLASLMTVAAPDDFDGAVRSRIAIRRDAPSLSRPSLLLVAKFAFPVLLLLGVGAYLMISAEQEMSGDMVPPIADGSPDVAVIDDAAGSGSLGISNAANMNSPIARTSVNRAASDSKRAAQGGSEDAALLPDDSIVFPDGVDPRKAIATNAKPPSGGSISPADVLLMIGISSNCSPAGCAATAVREGSIAATAGIQSGDLISAIDGRSINSSAGTGGRFSVSELTVVRAGRRMTISIARR